MNRYFLLWIAVPVIFWPTWLWITRWRPLRHLGTLHFLLYFFSIYAGAYSAFAEHGSRNPRFLLSVIAYPVFALVGVFLVAFFTNRPLGGFGGQVPREAPSRSERRTIRFVTIGLVGVLITFFYVLGDRIPLLVLINEGAGAGMVARYEATKGYHEVFGQIGPLVWLSRILIDYFSVFLLIYEYCRVRLGRSTYGRLLTLGLLLLVVTVAFNERYPAVKLLFYFVILAAFCINRPTISPRAILWGLVLFPLALPILAAIHIVTTHGPGALMALPSPISDLFYEGWVLFVDRGTRGQVTGIYYVYEMVPGYYDFFGGRTFANPRGILPYEAVNLPYLVCDWHLKSPEGTQCSDPSVFFSEVYANFGVMASLVSMTVMGAVLQFGNQVVRKALDTTGSAYFVALFAMTAVYGADFAIGSPAVHFDARFYLIVFMFVAPRLRWGPSVTGTAPAGAQV